jgi:acyl-coenzyme A synthetase/AMP-(fatty) acid ligase
MTEKDIEYRCIKSKATAFVGDIISIKKFLAIRKNCPSIRTTLQVGDAPSEDVVSLYSALESVESEARFPSLRQHWSTPALIYFTSGTSGPPKMVRHNQVSYPLGMMQKHEA